MALSTTGSLLLLPLPRPSSAEHSELPLPLSSLSEHSALYSVPNAEPFPALLPAVRLLPQPANSSSGWTALRKEGRKR